MDYFKENLSNVENLNIDMIIESLIFGFVSLFVGRIIFKILLLNSKKEDKFKIENFNNSIIVMIALFMTGIGFNLLINFLQKFIDN